MKNMARMLTGTIVCLSLLTGCGWKWWAAKQVVKQTAEDVAESANLSKTKEELREDIKELKKKLNEEKEEKIRLELKVRELEATCGKSPLNSLPTGQ